MNLMSENKIRKNIKSWPEVLIPVAPLDHKTANWPTGQPGSVIRLSW